MDALSEAILFPNGEDANTELSFDDEILADAVDLAERGVTVLPRTVKLKDVLRPFQVIHEDHLCTQDCNGGYLSFYHTAVIVSHTRKLLYALTISSSYCTDSREFLSSHVRVSTTSLPAFGILAFLQSKDAPAHPYDYLRSFSCRPSPLLRYISKGDAAHPGPSMRVLDSTSYNELPAGYYFHLADEKSGQILVIQPWYEICNRQVVYAVPKSHGQQISFNDLKRLERSGWPSVSFSESEAVDTEYGNDWLIAKARQLFGAQC